MRSSSNCHIHTLAMDGVFVDFGPEHELVFLEQLAPSQEEVEALCETIARRVMRRCEVLVEPLGPYLTCTVERRITFPTGSTAKLTEIATG